MKAELDNPITGGKFNPLNWKLWVGGIVIVAILLFGLLGGKWIMAKISGIAGIGGEAGDELDLYGGNL